MPTLPPDISYFVAAVQAELDDVQKRILALETDMDILGRRAADLQCVLKYAERFSESCRSVGNVADYVAPDEIVGELPERSAYT